MRTSCSAMSGSRPYRRAAPRRRTSSASPSPPFSKWATSMSHRPLRRPRRPTCRPRRAARRTARLRQARPHQTSRHPRHLHEHVHVFAWRNFRRPKRAVAGMFNVGGQWVGSGWAVVYARCVVRSCAGVLMFSSSDLVGARPRLSPCACNVRTAVVSALTRIGAAHQAKPRKGRPRRPAKEGRHGALLGRFRG